jgi:hypothetical protein
MNTAEQFDRLGNVPRLWVESSLDLLTASAELHLYFESVKPSFPFSRSFGPRLMLRAFALECLFKAHVLLSGCALCVNGKIRSNFKQHDLSALARTVGFEVTAEEHHVLKKLSAFAIGSARYPVWPRFDKLREIGGSNSFRCDWGSPHDDLLFASVLRRLLQPFPDLAIPRRIFEKA